MSTDNVTPIRSVGAERDDQSLRRELSLLRVVDDAISEDGEIDDVPAVYDVIQLVIERITKWMDAKGDDVDVAPVYDALDVCAVISAVFESGLELPYTGLTVSPIRGVLRLGIGRLREFFGEPEEVEGQHERCNSDPAR